MFQRLNLIILSFFCVSGVLSFPIKAQTAGQWELRKDEQGMKIYTRFSAGSSIKEVKAIMQINASLSSVVALASDFENYSNWVYKCKTAKQLKSVGDSDLTYYHITETPWPLSNRDAISRVVFNQNKKNLELRIHSYGIPHYLPQYANLVRIPKSNTLWILTPISENTIQGEYLLSFDPGGEVPAWLINLFVTDGPFESLLLLKQKVQDPKYKNAQYPFIQNYNK